MVRQCVMFITLSRGKKVLYLDKLQHITYCMQAATTQLILTSQGGIIQFAY